MINGDHGAYFVNDTGGYALSQRRNADGKIEISIVGPNSIKGLLIYAHDVIGNRIGNFETKVKGVVSKTDCGGTDTGISDVYIEAMIVREFRSWYILKKIKFDYTDPTSSVEIDPNAKPTASTNNNQFFDRFGFFSIAFTCALLIYSFGAFVEYLLKKQDIKAKTFLKSF
nr:562_t:CDS:2 [Entrophospora candida]